ncbi:flagellar filament capping protein FliD [Anaerocolumna jejuensis]|uniref:flagellar filament capping protein FliD n=1 Tax=Anaerocolumna jejuensis TaxID=259063 RepID=UPI003F7CC06E
MPIRMTGMISNMDTESLVKQLVSAQRMKNKKYSDKLTLSEWKEDKWKDLNTKLNKLYKEDLTKLRLSGNYNAKKIVSSNENLVTVTGDTNTAAVNGTYTLSDIKMASNHYITSGVIKTATGKATNSTKLLELDGSILSSTDKVTLHLTGNGLSDIEVTGDTTISQLTDKLKAQGLNANYDEAQGRLFISSAAGGVDSRFEITAGTATDVFKALKLDASVNVDGDPSNDNDQDYATIVKGEDSSVVLNGVKMTGKSNIIKVNGLIINLKGATASNEKISLSVSSDTDATYKMVKDFINNYNTILKEMNTLYYAASAKDYDPLSDDQKASMTDDQVKQWETKIKDSILRRDDTLGTLISSMKTAMMSSVKDPSKAGSYLALANYGIQTSKDYTEKGLLHIAGDSDDSTYSNSTNKLKAALEKDPATVITALSGIVKNVYDTMADKMSSIPNVRTAFTFYNDKTMDSEQLTLKKKIKELESKLTDMEDRYYKQFTAMEKAMSKMQSQTNALSSMLGTSS